MKINEFSLVNEEKIERAKHGTMGKGGVLVGGLDTMIQKGKLKEDDTEAYETALLAEYDRLGGLVTKDGLKLKTGSFWDFVKKEMRKEPTVVFVDSVDGEILEMDEEEAKVAKVMKAKTEELRAKRKKRAKKMMEDEE